MNIDFKTAMRYGKKQKINFRKVCPKAYTYGMNVELEHTKSKAKAAQIVLDHLKEYPDYYERLYYMELQADKDWKGKDKNIFI